MVRRSMIALGAVSLVVPLAVGPLSSAGASPQTVRLQGSMPALPSGTVSKGAVPRDQRISFRVELKLRDQAGANALALAVSTPGNAQRGKYLTPDQFRARFAPTTATVAKVSSWLAKQGFKVDAAPLSRSYVQAEGTAAQIEAALQTSLVNVDTNGKQRRVNTSEPVIPVDLASSIDGITGLTEVFLHPTNVRADDIPGAASASSANVTVDVAGNAPPPAGFRNAPPCSNFWAQKLATDLAPYGGGYPSPLPWAPCGWKPEQLRQAYGTSANVAGGNDGTGVTVGIVDAFASPNIVGDATTYAQRNDASHPLKGSQFAQKAFKPFTLQGNGPNGCGASGWYSEETLDVEAVHGMAPGANIFFAGAKSCQDSDIQDALSYIVDHHLADIVSNSYGNLGELVPPAEITRENKIHAQAAAEGIGLYFSSGDNGDESDNPAYTGPTPAADFPATSSLSTAVGGTSLGVDANGHVAVEHGWDTGISSYDPATKSYSPGPKGAFLYAAGGGPSRVYAQPAYQAGVVPDSIATGISKQKKRVTPDVGMVGDPNTGFLIGITQTFPAGVSYDQYRIGGTSLSSPLFAGVMALVDQHAGFSHGFANPWLYSLAGTSAFRDIKPGPNIGVIRRNFNNSVDASAGIGNPSVRTIDADLESLRTLNGYDTLTGLGAPNGAAFINAG